MDNPLLLERPDSVIDQIHAYARDIAYLIVQRDYSTLIQSEFWGFLLQSHKSENITVFIAKWGVGDAPPLPVLETFGYLDRKGNAYSPTEKIFSLLDKPFRPPTVFVSYRRLESSAFALLIEARLRIAGVDTIFIDKDILAGDDWHEELKEKIHQCKYFICLIGPTTLESVPVNKEIEYATQAGCTIIPIWHNSYTMPENYPSALQVKNAIQVTGQSAREYETAISQLLNDMDYRTY